MANLNIAESRLPQDGRIKIRIGGKPIDIRVSSLPTQLGERIVLRILDKGQLFLSLEEIGMEEDTYKKYIELLERPYGIILVSGPTGSGKTSTLYASLSRLNDGKKNIITVEDPVEYQIAGISQVQAKPSIGLTFAEGLRSILRQDPDIIMVGEIRDEETARIAIQAALTGHLVFSTIHTNDAPSSITRLLDMGIEGYLIASTCIGFMAQRLVRVLCPHCKKKERISISSLRSLGYTKRLTKKSYEIFSPQGCDRCMQTGYWGRTGVYELLVIEEGIRRLIVERKEAGEIRKYALSKGMRSLRESALEKVLKGITSLEEALRVT